MTVSPIFIGEFVDVVENTRAVKCVQRTVFVLMSLLVRVTHLTQVLFCGGF